MTDLTAFHAGNACDLGLREYRFAVQASKLALEMNLVHLYALFNLKLAAFAFYTDV